jgi:hypothetical protein
MPGNKCSNCAAYNFECKYEEAAKVCGPGYDLPAPGWALTHLVRNEDLRKGAWIAPRLTHMFQLLHKVMWKVSNCDWKKWRAYCNECVVQRGSCLLRFLILSSYARTPTSLKNWERRLIGKNLFETRCHAPFRISPARPPIDHRHSFAVVPILV